MSRTSAFVSFVVCTGLQLSSFSSPVFSFSSPSTAKQVKTIDLGNDQNVDLFVWENELLQSGVPVEGCGSIIRPAGLALASLIAQSPEIVNNRRVMDIGCGLGVLAATGISHGDPAHVAVCDRDPSVLNMAYATCTQLYRASSSISKCKMDWSDNESWPNQPYDVLLGSDILYDESSIVALVDVLHFYLSSSDEGLASPLKEALFADPIEQVNREAFCIAAHAKGLTVEEIKTPEMSGFVLLRVTTGDCIFT